MSSVVASATAPREQRLRAQQERPGRDGDHGRPQPREQERAHDPEARDEQRAQRQQLQRSAREISGRPGLRVAHRASIRAPAPSCRSRIGIGSRGRACYPGRAASARGARSETKSRPAGRAHRHHPPESDHPREAPSDPTEGSLEHPRDLGLLSRQRGLPGARRRDRRRGPGGALHAQEARLPLPREGDRVLPGRGPASRPTSSTSSRSTTSRCSSSTACSRPTSPTRRSASACS